MVALIMAWMMTLMVVSIAFGSLDCGHDGGRDGGLYYGLVGGVEFGLDGGIECRFDGGLDGIYGP